MLRRISTVGRPELRRRSYGLILAGLVFLAVPGVARAQPATITIPDENLFQDSFPQSMSIDATTQASRDALDIRIDAGVDGLAGAGIVSVDGVRGVATAGAPGTEIAKVTLIWSLSENPFFEQAIRSNVSLPTPGVGVHGWDRSNGFVEAFAPPGTTSFSFEIDLPDVDFMYPGDVLEYYLEVTDSDSVVAVYPSDLTGYEDLNTDYDSRFVVRALPTISDPTGVQPTVLFVNNNGHGSHEGPYKLAMANNGFVLGVDYDMYTVNTPDQGEPNGIGSAGTHGADWTQLSGYQDIIFTAGTRTQYLLNDGSGVGGNSESNDIQTLSLWQGGGDILGRDIALFGENLPCFLASGSLAAQSFLANNMSVNCASTDVRPAIGGANAPSVTPVSPSFLIGPFGVGGAGSHPFDEVDPGPGAITAHAFVGFPGESASIEYFRLSGTTMNLTMTYVFDLESPFEILRAGSETTASKLMSETLTLMQANAPSGAPVSAPSNPGRALQRVAARPNPFNPATSISFDLARSGPVSLRIYTIRGELVREFGAKVFQQGPGEIRWDGTDQAGQFVASGVYVAELRGGGETARQKMALVK